MTSALCLAPAAQAQPRSAAIIALGGASAERPADTAAAFDLAVSEGADFLETGLAPTQDGALIAREDHELSMSTDIAERPEFAVRKATKTIDGAAVSGWFSEDFTLAELKTLICRDPTTRSHGGRAAPAGILSFQDVMDFARAASVRQARVVGVCVTLRQTAYFASIELALEARTAEQIRLNGYGWAAAAMIVRSPEIESLKAIRAHSRARLAWLPRPDDPAAVDFAAARRFCEIVTLPATTLFDPTAPTPTPAPLMTSAHAAGLAIHARIDPLGDPYPPKPFKPGDLRGLFAALNSAGVDAVATDRPAIAARARPGHQEESW